MPKRLQLVGWPGGYRGSMPGTEAPWVDGAERDVCEATAEYLLETFPHRFRVLVPFRERAPEPTPESAPRVDVEAPSEPSVSVADLLDEPIRGLRKRISSGELDPLLSDWSQQDERATIQRLIRSRQRAISDEG